MVFLIFLPFSFGAQRKAIRKPAGEKKANAAPEKGVTMRPGSHSPLPGSPLSAGMPEHAAPVVVVAVLSPSPERCRERTSSTLSPQSPLPAQHPLQPNNNKAPPGEDHPPSFLGRRAKTRGPPLWTLPPTLLAVTG